jgi:hypothetical protein
MEVIIYGICSTITRGQRQSCIHSDRATQHEGSLPVGSLVSFATIPVAYNEHFCANSLDRTVSVEKTLGVIGPASLACTDGSLVRASDATMDAIESA